MEEMTLSPPDRVTFGLKDRSASAINSRNVFCRVASDGIQKFVMYFVYFRGLFSVQKVHKIFNQSVVTGLTEKRW